MAHQSYQSLYRSEIDSDEEGDREDSHRLPMIKALSNVSESFEKGVSDPEAWKDQLQEATLGEDLDEGEWEVKIGSMVCQGILVGIGYLTIEFQWWLIQAAIYAGVCMWRLFHYVWVEKVQKDILHPKSYFHISQSYCTALEIVKAYAPTTLLVMVLEYAMVKDCTYHPENYEFWTIGELFWHNSTQIFMVKYEIHCEQHGALKCGKDAPCICQFTKDLMFNYIAVLIAQGAAPFLISRFCYKKACYTFKVDMKDKVNQRALTFAVLHVIDVAIFGTMAWEVESFVFLKQSHKWRRAMLTVYGVALVGSIIYPLQFVYKDTLMKKHRTKMHILALILIDLPLGVIRGAFLYTGLTVSWYCFLKNVVVTAHSCAEMWSFRHPNSLALKATSWLVDQMPGAGEAAAELEAKELAFFNHQKTIAAALESDKNGEPVIKLKDNEIDDAMNFFDADADGNLDIKEMTTMLAYTFLEPAHIKEAYDKIASQNKGKVHVKDILDSEYLRKQEKKDHRSSVIRASMRGGEPPSPLSAEEDKSPSVSPVISPRVAWQNGLKAEDKRLFENLMESRLISRPVAAQNGSPEENKRPFISPVQSLHVAPESGKARLFDFKWPSERGQGGANAARNPRSCAPDGMCGP